jgi:HD-like signal output (HDOD) protein
MLSKSFAELKVTGHLPSPPGVVMRILKLSQLEAQSADEISATIMTDSALTGRLLKLANSAAAAGAHPVTTVPDATVRLGVRAVMNVALGLSLVSSNRTGRCAAFDYDGYWSAALARAVAAKTVAERMRGVEPAEAYVMGLLCDIGRLALASVHPIEYAELLSSQASRVEFGLARLEQERFAIDHTEVAALMIQDWGLPQSSARAIHIFEHADAPLPAESLEAAAMARILYCASTITNACLGEPDPTTVAPEIVVARLECVRILLNLDVRAFSEMCAGIAREWGRVGQDARRSDRQDGHGGRGPSARIECRAGLRTRRVRATR